MLDARFTARDFIRVATREDHDRLDARVSRLDLTCPTDLATFFAMNRIGFATLSGAMCEERIVARAALDALVAALDADLAALGHEAPPTLTLDRSPRPAALDHIVLGSRLGTKVLRKRWQAGQDTRALRAGTYFATSSMVEAWQTHLAHLQREVDLDGLVTDVRWLFTLFEAALAAAEEIHDVT